MRRIPLNVHTPWALSRTRARGAVVGATLAGLTVAAMATVPATAAPGKNDKALTERVSLRTGGFPGHDVVSSGEASTSDRRLLSTDGRFSVFATRSELVGKNNLTEMQIFQRDRLLGTTTRVSDAKLGRNPSMSADGRFVAFTSDATNVVAGDNNANSDVFVTDMVAGSTTRVSVNSAGGETAGRYGSDRPSISANGRYVAFLSYAAGMVAGDTADTYQAYVHDRETGTTSLASVSSSGVPATAMVETSVSVSNDGNRVVFESVDQNITADAGNSDVDVFVRDLAAGTTTRVSKSQEWSGEGTISADGSTVAFYSRGADLVAPGTDTNGAYDVFVYDIASGATSRVSVSSGGGQGDGVSNHPGLSADGRYVVFDSVATNLVPGDTNATGDVFRHDRVTGETTRVSLTRTGAQIAGSSTSGSISPDGMHVQFEAYGSDITRDPVGHGTSNVFVRDLRDSWPAMYARVKKLPKKVKTKKKVVLRSVDIARGEKVLLVWKPKGRTKGKAIKANVTVKANKVRTRAPKRAGNYVLTVSYVGERLKKGTVTVRK